MKPEFYVIRLGRQRDNTKPVLGQMPQAPRGQRGFRNFDVGPAPEELVAAEPNPIYLEADGFGQELIRSELRDPVIVFSTQEIAEVHAKELATKNPKVLYGVLGVLSVYETGEAPVIEKTFNNAGELVLKENQP